MATQLWASQSLANFSLLSSTTEFARGRQRQSRSLITATNEAEPILRRCVFVSQTAGLACSADNPEDYT
jgi:hypothetical protein